MLRCLLFFCAIALAGCATTSVPSLRLSLDGPPLALVMHGEAASWQGLMERGCMAGFGGITLHNLDDVTCEGQLDHPASDKGRLYAELVCTSGETMTLVFRNLGPDQGMGFGRMQTEDTQGERMALFYHPSQKEAWRRLGEVRQEIASMLDKQQNDTPPDTATEE